MLDDHEVPRSLAEYMMKQKVEQPKDRQVGGYHYKYFKIQPYVFCYENGLNNLQSEVVSYVVRYNRKWEGNKEKQIEDLEKAIHTIELLISEIKKT